MSDNQSAAAQWANLWEIYMRENRALCARAEAAEADVARLRAELAQVRAEGEANGAARERVAVAAYLRERHALRHYAGCIERGEHVGAAGGGAR